MYFIDVNDALKEVSYTLTRNSDLSLPDRYALIDNLPFPVESALYAFMVRTPYRILYPLTAPNDSFLVEPWGRYCYLARLCLLSTGKRGLGSRFPHSTVDRLIRYVPILTRERSGRLHHPQSPPG